MIFSLHLSVKRKIGNIHTEFEVKKMLILKRSCLEEHCYFQQHMVNLPQWWRCEDGEL